MPSSGNTPAGSSSSSSPRPSSSNIAPGSSSQPTVGNVVEPTPVTSPAIPNAPLRDGRSPPPGGIVLPSRTSYASFKTPTSPNQAHLRSPSAPRVTTPTGLESHGYSSTFTSPGMGPLSPGLGPSNPNSSSFIFPIRSVFSGIAQAEGSGSGSNSESSGSAGLGGNSPRATATLSQTDTRSRTSPSTREDRRFSQMLDADQELGIASIAQMLEGQAEETGAQRVRPKATGETGTATFTGKVDRSGGGEPKQRSPRASPYGYGIPPSTSASGIVHSSSSPLPAFLSAAPLSNVEPAESPFFRGSPDIRRASDGDEVNTPGVNSTASSGGGDTPKRSTQSIPNPPPSNLYNNFTPDYHVQNSSAEASGSGLPQKNRAPVGQPQEEPAGVNFRDRPGPSGDSGENLSFSSAGAREVPKPGSDPRCSDGHDQSGSQGSSNTQIQAPRPQHAGSGGLEGLAQVTKPESARSTDDNFEESDDGERRLINDFASIVRLGDIGSSQGGRGGTGESGDGRTGTDSRSRNHGRDSKNSAGGSSGPSGGQPTQARLAQQQREIGKSNAAARDSVQRFVSDQSHTQTMSDPNSHTSTSRGQTPVSSSSDLVGDLDQEDDESAIPPSPPKPYPPRHSISSAATHDREATGTDESLASLASSEIATASLSGREDSVAESEAKEEEPEPIVTMRYEHVATEDGHHMVVGREGKLSKCEDEPITTPGAVQGFGVLVVLEEDYEKGTLTVRQVSENSTELLGLSPKYLFRLDCFSRILTDEQEDILRDNLEYLPDAAGNGSLDEEGPQVFLLSGFGEPGTSNEEEDDNTTGAGRASARREWTCWVAAHRPKQPTWDKVDEKGIAIPAPDLVVLEFELERDTINPLMQTFEPTVVASSGRRSPDSASDSIGDRTNTSGQSNRRSQNSNTTVGTTPRPAESPSSEKNLKDTLMRRGSEQPTEQSSTARPDSSTAETPQGLDGLEVEIPLERIIESTTNHAKPLRALERMRRSGGLGDDSSSRAGGSARGSSRGGRGAGRRQQRRQQTGSGTMDVFAVLGQMNEQLGSAPDLETFLKVVVGVVQDVCRFHRVLLYQFDESYNGQVVAELVEWGKTTDLYKGLMFPAADIPAQARQLYMINKVRLLYDRSQTTARMVLRDKADLDHPLDMTHCFLRAMSPIHIKYLANMHVRSSMSVSIMAFGQLWGLIACHTYGYHGMRVSFPVRQMMRILSDSISRNIERLSYAQRLHTRKLISTIPTQAHPTGYIVSNADDLLQVFDADAGLLVIGSGCKLLGISDQGQAMLAIAEYLRIVKFDNLKASNHLSRDFPDLSLPRAHDTIAGLLYVPLTAKAGQDFIVFLRKGQAREVKWAGKPYKDEQSGTAASLEPRKSFKTWSEVVTGRSRVWTDDQLESAGVLALIYGKFIQVWREKQSAMANNQLTAILLSNTSHAVRTPLSQIINTLELALAGNIDDETRAMLENSHKASRALLFHVHDLLDLTRIETGNETSFNDPFDLRASIHDAVRLYQTESARRGLEFRVNIAPNIPQYVIGDSRKIKTVISNMVANSVKFTPSGFIEVYCGLQHSPDESTEVTRSSHVMLEFVVADSGVGIANDKLQAMFVTLEGADEVLPDTAPTGLGLGLAVVARIVEQLDGQLRAESEVGVGTRFFFTLEMLRHDAPSVSSRSNSAGALGPVTRRTSSGGSVASVASNRSGGQASEIDSFVHDFGSSHMFPSVGPDDPRLKAAEKRMNAPGSYPVTDSSWPVRPTRVDTDSDTTSDPSVNSIEPPSPQLDYETPSISPLVKQARRINYVKSSENGGSGSGSGSSSAPKSISGLPANVSKHRSAPPSDATGATVRSSSKPSPRTKSTPRIDPASPLREKEGPGGAQRLRVLVVEDDIINCQILTKRLKMDKHTVMVAGNGQEAVDILKADWDIDVVLMDIQMPIMDGRTAAAEIRKLEATNPDQSNIEPLRVDGRIPIFAVSASLYESDRSNLSEHFDGWLLKPLDFTRVRVLLKALQDDDKRAAEVYVQGHWEKGGYFRGSRNKSPPIKQSPQV